MQKTWLIRGFDLFDVPILTSSDSWTSRVRIGRRRMKTGELGQDSFGWNSPNQLELLCSWILYRCTMAPNFQTNRRTNPVSRPRSRAWLRISWLWFEGSRIIMSQHKKVLHGFTAKGFFAAIQKGRGSCVTTWGTIGFESQRQRITDLVGSAWIPREVCIECIRTSVDLSSPMTTEVCSRTMPTAANICCWRHVHVEAGSRTEPCKLIRPSKLIRPQNITTPASRSPSKTKKHPSNDIPYPFTGRCCYGFCPQHIWVQPPSTLVQQRSSSGPHSVPSTVRPRLTSNKNLTRRGHEPNELTFHGSSFQHIPTNPTQTRPMGLP